MFSLISLFERGVVGDLAMICALHFSVFLSVFEILTDIERMVLMERGCEFVRHIASR